MDKLTTLAISYPDFQLNQIIDPEQMDLNNLQIVNKINTVIKAFNELIQGTSGAGNITIAPIPEFSDAKTVQQALQKIATFVKTLDADTKRQFAELVQKNSQQDTEIQSIKSVNTRQDSRLQSLESTQTNHTQRIGVIEQKNTSQDDEINAIKQKNNEQDGRLTKAEGAIGTHTSQISKVQEKDAEQDRRISGIESREELDTAFVTKIEKRVGVNETDIQKLQEDFAQLESKDPVAEIVIARTSGHTQETFRTLGDRLDHNEIPVKTDFTGQLRGAVNFRVVDENTTETWENHVKLGDITAHNESPIAHEVMMAEHEMDETSHSDIREKIKDIYIRLDNVESGTMLEAILRHIEQGYKKFEFRCKPNDIVTDSPCREWTMVKVNATETFYYVECIGQFKTPNYYRKIQSSTSQWYGEWEEITTKTQLDTKLNNEAINLEKIDDGNETVIYNCSQTLKEDVLYLFKTGNSPKGTVNTIILRCNLGDYTMKISNSNVQQNMKNATWGDFNAGLKVQVYLQTREQSKSAIINSPCYSSSYISKNEKAEVSLENGWTGKAFLNKIGNICFLSCGLSNGIGELETVVLNVPLNFRPQEGIFISSMTTNNTSSSSQALWLSSNGDISIQKTKPIGAIILNCFWEV